MDTNQRWRQLESQIPAEQLLPSVAFSVCCPSADRASRLDLLRGADFVHSLLSVLWVQSKARNILECWCILMMRSRLDDERKKDGVYDLLLSGPPVKASSVQLRIVGEDGSDEPEPENETNHATAMSEPDVVSTRHKSKNQREADKKQKVRWKRGVVVLAHLLIDRAQHGETSLLHTYLDQVFFSWSVATEQKLDFLLSSRVIAWIQEARTHFTLKHSKIDRKGWAALSGEPSSAVVVGREQKEEVDSGEQKEYDHSGEQKEEDGGSGAHKEKDDSEEREDEDREERKASDNIEEHKQVDRSSNPLSVPVSSSSASGSLSTGDALPANDQSLAAVSQRRSSTRLSTAAHLSQTAETMHDSLVSNPRKRRRSTHSMQGDSARGQRRQRHDRDDSSEEDHDGTADDDQDGDSDEDRHPNGEQRWKQREAALMAVFLAWTKAIKARLLQAIPIEQADQLQSVKAIAMELDAPPFGLVGGRRDEEKKSSEPADADGESKDWMCRGWVEVYEEAAVGGQGVRATRDIPKSSSARSAAAVAVNLYQAGEEFIRLRSDELAKDPTYLIPFGPAHWFDVQHHWVGKVNHLPTPHCNLKLTQSGKIVQLRSIIRGEALSFDYGQDFWVYRVTGLELDEWLAGNNAETRQARSQLFTTMHKKVSDYKPLLRLQSLTEPSTMMEREELIEALSKTLADVITK